MYEHFNNIGDLYGDAYVQIPNDMFRELARAVNNKARANIQQISFAYTYIVTVAFLYKYAHFVDVDNGTYIQNSDIKQILGYNKTTKTVDKIIKKDGILEQLGLINTTKEYPVSVEYTDEKINNMHMRDFTTVGMLGEDDVSIIKSIVKNKNYEVKKPSFLFEYNGDIGTLYNYERTHRITLKEYMKFIYDDELDNTGFLIYAYFKYKCYGLRNNMKSLALYKIVSEIGVSRDTFYTHLNILKKKGYIHVSHKGWRVAGEEHDSNIEANEYYFKGIL